MYLVVIIVLLGILFYMLFAGPSQSEVRDLISTANYCGSPDDCAVVESKCPFGCNVYVNKGEVDRVNELMGEFDSDCNQSCQEPAGVSCFQGRCQAN